MSMSRRSVFAATGVAAASATTPFSAAEVGPVRDPIVERPLARLSWMFPRPRDSNMMIGLRLRIGRLREEFTRYIELYRGWYGAAPGEELAQAACATIYSRLGVGGPGIGVVVVTEDSFATLTAEAKFLVQNLESDPRPFAAVAWSAPRAPRRRAKGADGSGSE